jgi:hypothetical protein
MASQARRMWRRRDYLLIEKSETQQLPSKV